MFSKSKTLTDNNLYPEPFPRKSRASSKSRSTVIKSWAPQSSGPFPPESNQNFAKCHRKRRDAVPGGVLFLRFHWDTKQKFCWLAALASFNCTFIDTARYSSRIPLFCPMVCRIVNCTNLHHGIALIWQHRSRKNFAARSARR